MDGFTDGSAVIAQYGTGTNLYAAGEAVYVGDHSNSAIRRLDKNTGQVMTILGGNANGSTEGGYGTDVYINNPTCVWMNESETEGYVGTESNVVYRITRYAYADPTVPANWRAVRIAGTYGMSGTANGDGNNAFFYNMQSIYADPSGSTVYVAEYGNHSIRRLRVKGGDRDDAESWQVERIAGGNVSGDADGLGPSARFNQPIGLSLAKDGTLYIVEFAGHRIRKMTPDGMVTLLAGSSTAGAGLLDGVGGAARFYYPSRIAYDSAGFLYVSDGANSLIRRVNVATGEVKTTAGIWNYGSSVDGPGNAAGFGGGLWGITYDLKRGLYVADSRRIRLIERIVRNGGNP